MVAILLPQPDEPARGPGPATGRPVPSRRRATNPCPRPVDLATVEAIPLRPVPRALPDRPTRIRRRRLVALIVAVALFAAATAGRALLGAAASVEPSSPPPVDTPASSPAGETYVVRPGDTLWSIAAAIAPDSDPRPVVDALRDANGGRPELQVGERLVVRLD